METFEYVQMDVFADRRLEGNGLAVVFCDRWPEDAVMLAITRAFRQFETIFLKGFDGQSVQARIFTMEEELPFAGHPVLGAAGVLHGRHAAAREEMPICFQLREKPVSVVSRRTSDAYRVTMDQGAPVFLGEIRTADILWFAAAHSLPLSALVPALPPAVVSTGLPYLLLPVQGDLTDARIVVTDLQARLAAYGARYSYLFNPWTLHARTWDNLGLVEDAATGSAAGPVCAYLVRCGWRQEGETLVIHQGAHAHRPSTLYACQTQGRVSVSGDVFQFAQGTFALD